MGNLIVQILPLAFGAAISPMVLAVTILTLSSSVRPISRTVALAFGQLVPLLLMAVPGVLLLGKTVGTTTQPGHRSGVAAQIDLAFGIALLVLAAGLFVMRMRKRRSEPTEVESDNAEERPANGDTEKKEKGLVRYGALGAGAMFTNFSTIVIFLPAVKAIAISPTDGIAKAAAILVLITVTLFPTLVPLAAFAIAPGRASKVLTPVSDWAKAHSREIGMVLMLVIGLYLLVKGLRWV